MVFETNLDAVKFYQDAGIFHPLTCGFDGDDILVPSQEGGEIVLSCKVHPEYRQVMDDRLTKIVIDMAWWGWEQKETGRWPWGSDDYMVH